MAEKIIRLDSRRDIEAITWAKELHVTDAWFHSSRFRHITRLHTSAEVVSLRGNLQADHTIAKQAAIKLYDYLQRLFRDKKQETTYGPVFAHRSGARGHGRNQGALSRRLGDVSQGFRIRGPGRRLGQLCFGSGAQRRWRLGARVFASRRSATFPAHPHDFAAK